MLALRPPRLPEQQIGQEQGDLRKNHHNDQSDELQEQKWNNRQVNVLDMHAGRSHGLHVEKVQPIWRRKVSHLHVQYI